MVASVLAEASKFLFFDTGICRKAVWFPPGTESLPRTAECSLGATAVCGIASGIIFLICLILVCLKAPSRRELEPNYGLDVVNGNIEAGRLKKFTKHSSFDSESDRDPNMQINRPPIRQAEYYHGDDDGESGVTSMNSRGYESGYESSVVAKSSVQRDTRHDDDDLISEPQSTTTIQTGDGNMDDKHNQLKLPAMDVTIIRNRSGGNPYIVSKSRLETVERMEKNANNISHDSAQMIDEFLNDLNESFQPDSSSNEITKT